MASVPAAGGHEGFVQPSSYLPNLRPGRPRGQSRGMNSRPPITAVDRDQRKGLVSGCSSSIDLSEKDFQAPPIELRPTR